MWKAQRSEHPITRHFAKPSDIQSVEMKHFEVGATREEEKEVVESIRAYWVETPLSSEYEVRKGGKVIGWDEKDPRHD